VVHLPSWCSVLFTLSRLCGTRKVDRFVHFGVVRISMEVVGVSCSSMGSGSKQAKRQHCTMSAAVAKKRST
jgi:hypothetical protein